MTSLAARAWDLHCCTFNEVLLNYESVQGLELQRFDPSICVYSMLPHDPALPAPQRYNVLYRMIPSAADGLSTLQCTVNTTLLPLHTSILADW